MAENDRQDPAEPYRVDKETVTETVKPPEPEPVQVEKTTETVTETVVAPDGDSSE